MYPAFRNWRAIALLLSSMWVASAAQAINFTFTFEDRANNTGVGFDDATVVGGSTLGQIRENTVAQVAQYIDSKLNESGNIDFYFDTSETDGSGALASAGTFIPATVGFSNGLTFEHATTGVDPSASNPDAVVKFDFGYNYNSGTGAAANNQFDLYTVTLHELLHTMGLFSLIDDDGSSRISGTSPGTYSIYDSLLEDGNGNRLLSPSAEFIGNVSDLTSNNVKFAGAAATLANGGNAIPIHSPSPYKDGSSLGHVAFSLTSIQNPSISPGLERRTLLDFDLGMLQDLGWTLANPIGAAAPIAASAPHGLSFALVAAFMIKRRQNRRSTLNKSTTG